MAEQEGTSGIIDGVEISRGLFYSSCISDSQAKVQLAETRVLATILSTVNRVRTLLDLPPVKIRCLDVGIEVRNGVKGTAYLEKDDGIIKLGPYHLTGYARDMLNPLKRPLTQIRLEWLIAHELYHLRQLIQYPQVTEADIQRRQAVYNTGGNIYQSWLTFRSEYAAELFAAGYVRRSNSESGIISKALVEIEVRKRISKFNVTRS